MTTIILIELASAFAVLALLLKARGHKPKTVDRLEKAEIVKQLLALSERENMVKAISRQGSAFQAPALRRRAAAGSRYSQPLV